MPPPLGLALALPTDDDEDDPLNKSRQNLGDSLRWQGGDSFNRSSLNFGQNGVSRGRAGGDEVSYKICERDLRFMSELGKGASSVVHKALLVNHQLTGTTTNEQLFVAVKKIEISARENRDQMHNDVKFLIDATSGQAGHDYQGLIKFHGAYHSQATGQIFIVLEYMSGGSLQDVLAKVGKVPEAILSKWMLKVLKGLYYLHKKMHMVHRDIKPANILLSGEGDPKITDFGISKSVEHTYAMCETFLGTTTYMSPERMGSKPYGFASDIWSLGLCVFECATGKYPYDAEEGVVGLMVHVMQGEPPVLPAGEYSPELIKFVSRCLKRDPDARATALELLSDPFLLKHRDTAVDMAAFMHRIDSKSQLDDIAFYFAHNYYRLFTLGFASPDPIHALAPLYLDASVYTHQAVRVTGRAAITQSLLENASLMKSFGFESLDVASVDSTGLPGGEGVLLNVQGVVRTQLGKELPFAECFSLKVTGKTEYFICNQMFCMLQG